VPSQFKSVSGLLHMLSPVGERLCLELPKTANEDLIDTLGT